MIASDRIALKEKIRQRISQNDTPGSTSVWPFIDGRDLVRVAVYIATNEAAEADSVELQCNYYKSLIAAQPNCSLVGIYVDCRNRPPQIDMLMDDCHAGKIDLIITKNVNRLCINVVGAIELAYELSRLTPPVGIYFETENIYTLDLIARHAIDRLHAKDGDYETLLKSTIMQQALNTRHNFDYMPCRSFQEKGTPNDPCCS